LIRTLIEIMCGVSVAPSTMAGKLLCVGSLNLLASGLTMENLIGLFFHMNHAGVPGDAEMQVTMSYVLE